MTSLSMFSLPQPGWPAMINLCGNLRFNFAAKKALISSDRFFFGSRFPTNST